MIVALIGLLISLFAYLIAFPDPRRRRFDVYLPLLALHILAAVAYWIYHFEGATDAFTYYRDPFNYYARPALSDGTVFVTHVVQSLRGVLGGAFLHYFLLFQCFGMIGIALIMRSFVEIADSLAIEVPVILYLLLFLPGLHFWSVAIGKDAPIFMATALAAWSSIRIDKRFLWFALAILILAVIRPHVAAFAMIAAGLSLLIGRNISVTIRLLMVPLAIGGLLLTLALTKTMVGVDLTDVEEVSGLIERQQSLETAFGSTYDLQSLSFPLKVLTLLFRPLFFDAQGIMGLIVSFENLIMVALFGTMIYYWRDLLTLTTRVYHLSFCLIFATVTIIALALVNYNIGLGLRQRVMVMPAVLLIFATLYLYRRYRVAAAQAVAAEAARAEPQALAAGARPVG